MKIVSTIEARMTSSRLPGKVMMKAAEKPMLEHLVNRLKTVKSIDEIIIATTKNESDDIIQKLADSLSVQCFRGSEEDVLNRVLGAANHIKGDIIVEITGDCPIIDTGIIEQTIQVYLNNEVDYVSNNNVKSYPDGMDVQVFSSKVLERSSKMTNDLLDLEHVTLHIRNNPNLFSRINLISPPELFYPELGLTLDEAEDYLLLKNIIEHFVKEENPYFSCLEVIKYLNKNSELLSINNHIKRKGNS